MPPAYVKAYVKRNKNDAGDAEAICEAVTRQLLVRRRTMLVNALRAHLAEFGIVAWTGLVARQSSTGGKQRLGHISKAGNRYLRTLLVAGAMTMIRHAKENGTTRGAWLLALMERRSAKVAAIALANKIARIAWAIMVRGTRYREPVQQVA